jgi:hypothetical protein
MMTDPETGMTDEQLIALGELAYWSGQAEAGVRYMLELLVAGPAAEVIGSGRSFTEMLDLTQRLLPTRVDLGSIAVFIEEDTARLRAAMDVRNVMLHGYWDSADVVRGSALSVKVTRRRGSRAMEGLTVRDIRSAAQDLADATTYVFHTLFDAQDIEAGRVPQERAAPIAVPPQPAGRQTVVGRRLAAWED